MPCFLAPGHLGELFWLSASVRDVPTARRARLLNKIELEILTQVDVSIRNPACFSTLQDKYWCCEWQDTEGSG